MSCMNTSRRPLKGKQVTNAGYRLQCYLSHKVKANPGGRVTTANNRYTSILENRYAPVLRKTTAIAARTTTSIAPLNCHA